MLQQSISESFGFPCSDLTVRSAWLMHLELLPPHYGSYPPPAVEPEASVVNTYTFHFQGQEISYDYHKTTV